MSSAKKLNAWFATAICGNDITSSCLYVSALTISMAGQYAWISCISFQEKIFCHYKPIYAEEDTNSILITFGVVNMLFVV
ncbi:MAG: hypothetical protein ABJA78_01295 [Ferruginibacter sp.]